jgi:hypothetical protein
MLHFVIFGCWEVWYTFIALLVRNRSLFLICIEYKAVEAVIEKFDASIDVVVDLALKLKLAVRD